MPLYQLSGVRSFPTWKRCSDYLPEVFFLYNGFPMQLNDFQFQAVTNCFFHYSCGNDFYIQILLYVIYRARKISPTKLQTRNRIKPFGPETMFRGHSLMEAVAVFRLCCTVRPSDSSNRLPRPPLCGSDTRASTSGGRNPCHCPVSPR